MKLLIQRVSTASVEVDNQIVSSIEQGVMALVGFDKHDNSENLVSMAEKLLNFKIFNDHNGKIEFISIKNGARVDIIFYDKK